MRDVVWLVTGALRMLGWTLIHSLWLGSLAALALCCALRWIPPALPHVRYRVALGVLAAVSIGTAAIGRHLEVEWAEHVRCWERVEHLGSGPLILPRRCLGHVGSVAARLAAVRGPDGIVIGPGGNRGAGRTIETALAEAGGLLRLGPAERQARGPALAASGPLAGVTVLWALVAMALLARFLAGVRLLRRRVREAAPIRDAEAGRRLQELRRLTGVRRDVALSETPGLDSPVVAGWRRPTVLMPSRLVSTLTPDDFTAILTHELVHVRRGDYVVNLVQRALEAAFFINPFLLWISGRVRAEREAACDREVIRSGATGARSYVAGLLAAERQRPHRSAPAAALPHAGSGLLGRARRLAAYVGRGAATGRDMPPSRGTAGLIAALVSVALLCLPVAYGASAVSAYAVMSLDGRARRATLDGPIAGATTRLPASRPSRGGASPAAPRSR